MGDPLRVLIVEDLEDDVQLVERALRQSGYDPIIRRVDQAGAAKTALASDAWDIVIADYSLPSFSGLEALQLVRETGLDLPFILVSGTIGEAKAVAAMRAGAHDYVLKDNLARLGPAVRRELQEAQVRRARRRAEESLLESEARFRRMAENIQDGLFIIEHDTVVYVNERACEIFGYPREEFAHMTLLDTAAPEEQERLHEIVRQTQALGKEIEELETWIVRKDGSRRYIRSRYSVSREEGGVAGHYVVTTDLTERKLAEREVEERRRYLEGLLASAPDAIITLDAEHHIVEWNPGAEKLFGYPRDEVIGKKLDNLINDPSTYEQAVGFTHAVMGGESISPVEAVRIGHDGAPVDVIVAGSPILIAGEVIGAVAVYTDISERKRAERLLQSLNAATVAVEQALTPEEIFTTVGEQFQSLGFASAILSLDAARDRLLPVYFSYAPKAVRAAEKLVGLTAAEFSIAVENVDAFREAVHEGKTVLVDGSVSLRQMLPRPLRPLAGQLLKLFPLDRSICAPLVVEDEVTGVLSVQRSDLTDENIPAVTAFAQMISAAWRKAQLLQDLERSLEELKTTQGQLIQAQKMEALGRLAGGIAHDFNNLLTIIDISTRLLERGLHTRDPLWEHVLRVRETSERAAKLTTHLLSFSRREIVEPRVENLNRLVSDLSRMLQRIIGEDVTLVTHLASDLWTVKVDSAQMEQVIINLVVNARDAMPDGGLLSIETANVVLDDAYVARNVEAVPGEHIMLSIADTGFGMDDEVKSHLFEPFFTTKEAGEGTGLGLSTVFGIVKQSGGHILVESEPGQGTDFRIYLPRSREAESWVTEPPVDAPPGADRGTETILIAEDEQHVRELARQILAAQGYQVLAAANGLEALALGTGHEGPVHLLLTDVVMPHMNGVQLAGQLCAKWPELKVLYMSGYSDDVLASHGLLEDRTIVLPKPFTLEALTRKVRSVLDSA
jgi:PAS domain S-box-containing protein